jgi:aryl sulfotransferase
MIQTISKPAAAPITDLHPAENSNWPVKTRELHSHHFDSTIWNDFLFRNDDIVIATYAKSGTTWMQQIVAQLIFNGQEGLNIGDLSPWMDLRVPPAPIKMAAVEAQTHRRFLKTHLPVDALVFSPQAKYIYIGRDGRDVAWSLYNHHVNANEMFYDILNNTPGLVGPPIEPPTVPVRQYFQDWLQGDGYPFWSLWENVRSWWEIRHLPNVLMVHYADLKADLSGQMRRIAAFLDIPIDETQWDAIAEHCTFDYMKRNAEQVVPLGGQIFEGGAQTFINKGTNGRWRDTLTAEDIHWYESVAQAQLGDDCTYWLANGDLPAA